jgi:hypothetical protein
MAEASKPGGCQADRRAPKKQLGLRADGLLAMTPLYQ